MLGAIQSKKGVKWNILENGANILLNFPLNYCLSWVLLWMQMCVLLMLFAAVYWIIVPKCNYCEKILINFFYYNFETLLEFNPVTTKRCYLSSMFIYLFTHIQLHKEDLHTYTEGKLIKKLPVTKYIASLRTLHKTVKY